MPNWKKVITSGSDASLNSLYVSNAVTASVLSSSYIDLDVLSNGNIPPHKAGRIFFGEEDGALEVYNEEADITLQVGQENWIRAYNGDDSTILNGTPVRISGSQGDRPQIFPAIAQDFVSTAFQRQNRLIGVATHDIEASTTGYVTSQGIVRGVDTSAFAAGTTLYLQTGSAGLRDDPPPYPYDTVRVGWVIRSASPNGFIHVETKSPTNFADINNLSGSAFNAEVGDLISKIANGGFTYTKTLSGSYTIDNGTLNVDGSITGSGLQLTSPPAQGSETTSLMIGGDGNVGTRELGSNAFNSTAFTTCTGTVTSVGGTGTVSGITLSGTVTSTGNLTLGGTFTTTTSSITDFNTGVGTIVDGCGFTTCTGTVTGTGTDNQVMTSTGGTGIQGEANLTFNGSTLSVNGNIGLGENDFLILDYDGDSFGFLTNDASDNFGYGSFNNIYATSGTHVFINGEEYTLSDIQAGRLKIGSSHTFSTAANSSIAGGSTNTISSPLGFIGGGSTNSISTTACCSFIGGGYNNNICAGECWATIGGGCSNRIQGDGGTIGGGRLNCADGACSSILGGQQNYASATFSAIGGGYLNQSTGACSFVGGGQQNCATATRSAVAGGYLNCARGVCSFTGGGFSNDAVGTFSVIAGGYNNTNNENCSFIGGGTTNTITGTGVCHIIVGGGSNCINTTGDKNTVSGGGNNDIITNVHNSTIGGGASNIICRVTGTDYGSTIGGGAINCILESHTSTIGGGCKNLITGADHATIAGGHFNTGSGDCSFIGGGCNNNVSNSNSGILGGSGNTVTHQNSFAIGSNLTSTAACTTFVNNLDIESTAQIHSGLGVTGSVEFVYEVAGPAAWSAGGALITARQALAGAGTQNAGLAFGGQSPATVSCTEEYNGSSWSTGGALINSRRNLAGAGEQNAGLAFGGQFVPIVSCTEEYNGSSWSTGGALITARSSLAGAGTQNAGLAFGGFNAGFLSCTEEYNGSSWSTGGALITARQQFAGAGEQNAGLAFGGITPSTVSCTEEYNGSSWSTGGALITARNLLAGAGTQNAGLAFGGSPSSCTEEYDGSSWSAGGALITARNYLAGSGEQNAGLAFGGRTPSIVSCTEEYTPPTSLTKSFEYSSTTGQTLIIPPTSDPGIAGALWNNGGTLAISAG